MVTTTWDDDMPTHDALGTDLRRVAAMLAAGYDEMLMSEALGLELYRVRYAVMVLTNDRDGCPTEEEIAAGCERLQAGWTPDMFVAARRREPRNSSLVVRPGYAETCRRKRESHQRRQAARVAAGIVPIREMPLNTPSRRFQARVEIQAGGRRVCASQSFPTREEAEAWGREWLKRQWEMAQAGACVGK